MRYVTARCPLCLKRSVLDVDEVKLLAWEKGRHIQDAFPELTEGQRELIKTGTHPACWDEMLGDEE
jgi:hypothetical protein